MTFASSVNASNVHFQNTSGNLEIADRLRQYPVGTTLNLGMSLAGGTFTIEGSDGTALSASNPAYVVLTGRATPGMNKVYEITANQTFIDDSGASTIIGNLFGLTTSIAYAQDMPFFIYAVANDTENAVSFMISRIPHRTISPPAANIGKTGSAVADTQGSFFALGNPTVADYDINPCVVVGSIRMQMSAADDWTVQTIASATDGFGVNWEGTIFSLLPGQFGSAAGSFFQDNGGTAPAWSDQAVSYIMDKNGIIHIFLSAITRTAGAGAVSALFALPFVSEHGGDFGGADITGYVGVTRGTVSSSVFDFTITNATTFKVLQNADIAGGIGMRFGATYQVSKS
ncbi:MAG: hypothetical protein ACE5GV_00230 [Candidatus Scalindua sp.]